jgi:outer membrane protein assembly factor BamB
VSVRVRGRSALAYRARWSLVALGLGACACRVRDEERRDTAAPLPQVWPIPELGYFLTQPETGVLTAVDAATAKPRWHYRAEPKAKHDFVVFPPPKLYCPPVLTNAGRLIVMFNDVLVALVPDTGKAVWEKPFTGPSARNLCPAVTPDSGAVIVVRNGRGLVKIDTAGETRWSFTFPDGAMARGQPVALQISGDVLIRTDRLLYSINPDGRVNWAVPPAGD